MKRQPTLSAAFLPALASLLVFAPGCETTQETGGRGGHRVAYTPPEVVASVKTVSFEEMMILGKASFGEGRYRAAAQYFGAALNVRPGSAEAREQYSQARVYENRTRAPADMTESEVSLPAPPAFIQADLDAMIRAMEVRKGEETGPIVGPDERKAPPAEGDPKELEENRPPSLLPRIPDFHRGERPSIQRPTAFTAVGTKSLLPCDPLRTGRNHLFHTLIHLPAFEGARSIPDKTWMVESGADVSWGTLNYGSYGWGLYVRYDDNRYDEGYIKISHGLSEDVEARVELTLGNLREGGSDIYLTDTFDPYIRPYDRRTDLGNLILGLKTRLYRPDSSEPETGITAEAGFKIPVASKTKNFTTSGMPDFSGQLIASADLFRYLKWPRIVAHVAAGATIPFGETFFDRDVDLGPVALFGFGATAQLADVFAVVAQVEGNTSAFTQFDPLSGLVLTAYGGARLLLGNFIIEMGVGKGFTETSSRFVVTLNVGLRFMGSELEEEILR